MKLLKKPFMVLSIGTCTVLVIKHIIKIYILEVRKILRPILCNCQLSNFFLSKGLINLEQFNAVVFKFAKKNMKNSLCLKDNAFADLFTCITNISILSAMLLAVGRFFRV